MDRLKRELKRIQTNITYRQRNKGWQYIISYKPNLIWKQKTKQGFKTKKEAQKEAQRALTELNNQAIILPYNLNGVKLSDVFREVQERQVEYNTTLSYKKAAKKFLEIFDLELTNIQPRDIQRCVDRMLNHGLVCSSVKTYLGKLKTVFTYAVKNKLLIINPCDAVVLPKRTYKPKKKVIERDELRELLEYFKRERLEYALFFLLATTGLRIGEAIGLTWLDIDFIHGSLNVNKQWKRARDGKEGFGVTKSLNSNRLIPLPIETLKVLECFRNIKSGERVFNISVSRASRLNLKLKRFGCSFHSFRHTYGSNLIANGLDFKTVATLMGHSVQMTMNIYSHFTDEMYEKAKEKINNIF